MKKIKRSVRYERYQTALDYLTKIKDNPSIVCGFCLALACRGRLEDYPELYKFMPPWENRWRKNPQFWFDPYSAEGRTTRIHILTEILTNKPTRWTIIKAWLKRKK
jgi:hypothetical protein